MGVKNFVYLACAVPLLYASAIHIILFERQQGWLDVVVEMITSSLSLDAKGIPFLVLFLSICLWEISFLLMLFTSALNRDEDWDNRTPRASKERHIGLAHRADAAHLNESEQFPFIAVAIFSALYVETDPRFINQLCIGWLIHRIIFHIGYWLNIDALRSTTYTISFVFMILLFVSSILTAPTIDSFLDTITPSLFMHDIGSCISFFAQK